MDSNTMPMHPTTRSAFPPETPVGMAYIPWQTMEDVYDPEAGLSAGTIFPDLDKPWFGSRAFAGMTGGRSVNP